MKRIQFFIGKLMPKKKTKKEIDNQAIIGTGNNFPKYRILPNLRIAYAMPIALIFAGFGMYSIFFGKAASVCTTTLASGSTTASIQSTIENAANGSVVCLPSGSYGNLSINKKRTGYVTLQSVSPRGANFGTINLSQSSEYFRFESLTVGSVNAKYNITSGTSTSNIQIVDNDISGAGSYSANQYWLIEGNYFHDCGHCIEFSTSDQYMPSQHITIRGNKFMGPNDEDMIRVANFRDVLIENNEFINNFEHTVPLSQSSDGVCHCDVVQAVWGGSDLVFRNNSIINGTGQGFFVKDARITSTVGPFGLGTYNNITVENNLIVNNKKDSDSPAPQFSWGSAALTPLGIYGPANNVKVFNNTLWDNDGAATFSENITNLTVKNNIFSRVYASDGVNIASYDFNLSPTVTSASGAVINQGPNNISGSPTFAYANNATDLNQANWNYKLASTSRGIDKATNTSGISGYTVPTSDKDGSTRVDISSVTNGTGGFYDMGAFEYQDGSSPPPSDTTPPSVSITSPTNGATISGSTVTVSATASDNVGIVGVQFKIDGTNLGTEETSSPYSANLNTTTLSNGTHTITAVARDAAGNTATSSTITVTVNNVSPDTTPPDTSITSSTPANGASTTATTASVSFSGTDNTGGSGIASYECSLDSTTTYSTCTSPKNYTGLTTGSHTIRVRAKDAAGNTDASPASITFTITATSTCSSKQGDANNDQAVNILDISAILSAYGQTNTTNCADVNKDSSINITDISYVLSRYGT